MQSTLLIVLGDVGNKSDWLGLQVWRQLEVLTRRLDEDGGRARCDSAAPTPVPCPGDGDRAQLFGHPGMGVGSWVIAQPL